MSKPRSIPDIAHGILRGDVPRDFIDDGCSNAPDWISNFNIRWACRIHDWRYCTRCHEAGAMNSTWRRFADDELKYNLQSFLPWHLRWVGWTYRFFVWRYGGISAYDSCGPKAGPTCRHNVTQPPWMILARIDTANGRGNTK